LPFNDMGNLEPEILELSPEAKAAWVNFHDDVEAELRPGRDMAEARDVASKAADNAARLAALFHIFENDSGCAIGLGRMQAAACVVSWHLYEARRFIGEIALPVEVNQAVKLEGWLLEHCRQCGISEVSTSTIMQLGPQNTRKKGLLEKTLKELIEAGRVRVVKDDRRKLVKINPALLGGNNGTP
jgi:putative DNA primase/helicase